MLNDGLDNYRVWAAELFNSFSEGVCLEDHFEAIEENVAEELQEAGLSYDNAWKVVESL